jgi:hypothetical protein
LDEARSRPLQVGISDSKTKIKLIMQMEGHQMIYSPENTEKDKESAAGLLPERESIKIVATASGSLTSSTAVGESVVNGDFLILRNRIDPNRTTGDGIDEETSWTFYFGDDPNYNDFKSFSSSRPLTSALLTLTLTPKDEAVTTDVVLIESLSVINAPEIQTLPVDVTSTIAIELLDRISYTSTAILGILFSGIEGRIVMRYNDDAIISWAKLELTLEDQVTLS